MQYLSNITQRIVKVADISELSAVGSAMNAMNHTTGIQSSKAYNTRMNSNIAQKYRQEWSHWINILS